MNKKIIFNFILILCVILHIRNNKPYLFRKTSKKRVWEEVHTYWPMVPVNFEHGNPNHNLWSDDGPLDKYDKWLKNKFNLDSYAKDYEKKPLFNWLINKPSGYYVPRTSIDIKNFEKSSGVNINLDNNITENVELEINNKEVYKDMLTWWYGSCELQARAILFFNEPKKIFEDNGVVFFPTDIKGILTVIGRTVENNYQKVGSKYSKFKDTVVFKDKTKKTGQVVNLNINKVDNNNKILIGEDYLVKNLEDHVQLQYNNTIEIFNKNDILYIKHKTSYDITALEFHNTIKKWIKDDKPFAMDVDHKEEVWHYVFDKVLIFEIMRDKYDEKEVIVYNNLKKNNFLNKIQIMKCVCYKSNGEYETYKYYLVKNIYGKCISSGWISHKKPDFIWRADLNENWDKIKTNKRNPYVTPYFVNMLYKQSL